MKDYGFDLSDTRTEYISKDQGNIEISIQRHWYASEDLDEPNFKVSWLIIHKSDQGIISKVELPIGSTQEQAEAVARELWPEDQEASQGIYEMRAEEEAERRAGA